MHVYVVIHGHCGSSSPRGLRTFDAMARVSVYGTMVRGMSIDGVDEDDNMGCMYVIETGARRAGRTSKQTIMCMCRCGRGKRMMVGENATASEGMIYMGKGLKKRRGDGFGMGL